MCCNNNSLVRLTVNYQKSYFNIFDLDKWIVHVVVEYWKLPNLGMILQFFFEETI